MRRLTAHRVAAVQAELIQRSDVALAAITAHLAVKLTKDGFRCHRGGDDALTLSISDTQRIPQTSARREAFNIVRFTAQLRAWERQLGAAAHAGTHSEYKSGPTFKATRVGAMRAWSEISKALAASPVPADRKLSKTIVDFAMQTDVARGQHSGTATRECRQSCLETWA